MTRPASRLLCFTIPSLVTPIPDLLKFLGIEGKRLPDLVPATESVGGLTAKIAEATGLREGTPVSPAVHDQYAASLGAGSTRSGDVCLGSGTAWVLLANGEKPYATGGEQHVCLLASRAGTLRPDALDGQRRFGIRLGIEFDQLS